MSRFKRARKTVVSIGKEIECSQCGLIAMGVASHLRRPHRKCPDSPKGTWKSLQESEEKD